ncbi:regulatory protein RecX [Anaerovorax sp. IOR16]|uniref:regulatory protein RecX n=1 Tax=Anaerovorax sp. IOR16 TaxID=2773458 RepID=UPI0019D1E3BB|nr:regulatory protein RecX [Anaerovorax sp. IOR16]
MQKKSINSGRTAKDEAMIFLRYRDHTALEISNHLKQKEYNEKEIEECLEFLLDSHFIDDNRYCENYLRYALTKGKGSLRLRQELLNKGLDDEVIRIHMEEILDAEMEYSNAMKQVEKIVAGVKVDEKLIAKVGRRLSYLGYPTGLIYRILNQLRGD